MKNKGKIHPLTPKNPSFNNKNVSSALDLLPISLLTTVLSVLSLEEREVLAYMITRSTASSATNAGHKKCSQERHGQKALFECDCFDCYRSFWLRWDTSPNRLLIQEAIEKLEETGEQEQVKKGSGARKKLGRRKKDNKTAATSSNGGRAVEIPALDNHQASASEVDDVATDGHKGLARKLFQDHLTGIGSRLWGLWNPNVV